MADTNEGHQLATETPKTSSTAKNKHEDSGSEPNKKHRGETHKSVLEPAPWSSVAHVVFDPSDYISEYLKAIPALSIIKERGKVFTVHADHHAAEALNTMSKENVLSCPVYDRELEAYVGSVDYLDIVSLLVNIIQQLLKDEFDTASLTDLNSDQRDRLVFTAKQIFNSKTLFDISDLSKRDTFIPLHKSATLYQAIEILAKHGIHRVPIISEEPGEHQIEAIISQSAVVDFIFSNLDKFPVKAKKLVEEIMDTNKKVVTVPETALAFEAFQSLIVNKVTAVGVVNENSTLVGVLSATDIRMIGPHANTLGTLFFTVKEFVEKAREFNQLTLLPLIKATPKDTLGIVIEELEDNCVHRVFVVDDDDNPLSVLSMKDVLFEFLKK